MPFNRAVAACSGMPGKRLSCSPGGASALSCLLEEVRACRACEPELPMGARPVLVADVRARLLIAGQAPGTRVHATGIPWNDISGQRLRTWLGLEPEEFYDAGRVAIVPMGFCYPGRGRAGDLPPRRECRQLWHGRLFPLLPRLQLRVVIGQYAQSYHLAGGEAGNLTATVQAWREHAPALFPLPHPSPRNQLWLRRNPWFEAELLPALRQRVREVMRGP
jgi:uracil-DNA glycosylase